MMKSFRTISTKITALLGLAVILYTGCKEDQYYPVPETPEFDGNTYEYLKSKPGVYDSLLLVIDRVGLQSTLADSNITLFAVPNQSFTTALANLNLLRTQSSKGALSLRTVSLAHLDTLVARYIIRGKKPGDSLAFQDEVPLTSVRYGYQMRAKLLVSNSSGFNKGGSQYISFVDPQNSEFTRKWNYTTTGAINIKTRNAVVHEISPSHIFGFNEFVFRYTYNPPPPNLFITLGGKWATSHYRPFGTSEYFERSLDSDPITKFLFQAYSNSLGFWIRYEPAVPSVANAYTLVSADDDPPRDPKSWSFQGSMDTVTWVSLDTRFNEFFPNRQMLRVFYFTNTVAYKYYRIYFLENNGHGNWIQFADWSVNYKAPEED